MVITHPTEVLSTMAKWKNLIPKLLKERGMNIPQLQIKSGLGWPTIYKIATEEYLPDRTTLKTLDAVADAFGVSVSELYEREED